MLSLFAKVVTRQPIPIRDELATAGYSAQAGYTLANVGWKPRISYRYAFFEGDDPNGFGPNWSNVDDYDIPTVLIAAVTLAALLRLKKAPEPLVIVAAGVVGLLIRSFG